MERSSLVSGHADSSLEGLVENLAEGRVSVHNHGKLLDSGARGHGVGTLLDEVRSVDPNDVDAENKSSVLVEENLDHSLSLELGKGLGVGLEASVALAEGEALLLGLLLGLGLGQANHGDLGVSEARGGDVVVLHNVRAAHNVLDCRDTLGRRSMRKHHLSVCVADAVEVGDDTASLLVENLHLVRDLNETADSLDAHVLEANVLGVGNAARADEGSINVEGRVRNLLLGLGVDELDLDGLLSELARSHLGGEHRGVAVNLAGGDEHAVGDAADLGIKSRHHRVHGLDEGNLHQWDAKG